MTRIYSAPAAMLRGDVVRTTLGSKPVFDEVLDMDTRTAGGGSLSFGL